MPKANAFEKGMFAVLKGRPFLITEREFVKPGKGGAFVRLRLKDCRSGAVLRETLPSEASVDEAAVESRISQYLYADESSYHFMDGESYEQFTMPRGEFENKGRFMIEGESYEIITWEDEVLDIDIPIKMTFTVIDAPQSLKGNSVANTTKTVTIQNSIPIKAPLFINADDRIIVNTQTGEYLGRDNG